MTHTTTPVICSECGRGHYVQNASFVVFTCVKCGHSIESELDVLPYLDDAETLTVEMGVLVVVAD